MTVSQFIELIKQSPDLSGSFVCTLQTREVSALFLSQLYARLKSCSSGYATLDCELMPLDALKGQLEMSFLGNRMVYFVKNVHTLDESAKKSWESFVKKYEGPHCIVYAKVSVRASKATAVSMQPATSLSEQTSSLDTSGGSTHARIAVSLEQVDIQLYQKLAQFLYPDVLLDTYFLSTLFQHQETLTLDDACRMMAYQATVGRKCEPFFAQWLPRLIVPQKSFFTLSQYLFARKPRLFLEQWNLCKGEYPSEFWIAYWAEQVWQAMLFVQRARAEGVVEAKKSTYRLPFSFLNKDWSLYTPESLSKPTTLSIALIIISKMVAPAMGLSCGIIRFSEGFSLTCPRSMNMVSLLSYLL